jgi:K+-transporting ATPase ATPase A chain
MIVAVIVTALLLAAMLLIAWPLGGWIAKVIETPEAVPALAPFRWVEDVCARAVGRSYAGEMNWKEYFWAFLAFHTCGIVLLFVMLRWQTMWSFLDSTATNLSANVALNIAVSFVTNTNWQSYVPETALSWPVQMIGLTTQNFVSAAGGITLLCVLARAFRRAEMNKIGNFWRDLVRTVLYVLLPLSFVIAIVLALSGVPQSTEGAISYTTLEGSFHKIPVGMCASQVAIKQLGTNGGGFYAANGAHPLENPSPLSNLVEWVAILLIPMALCRTFADMVQARRQGILLLCVMMALFAGGVLLCCYAEAQQLPFFSPGDRSLFQAEGNMEGKECRFGPYWSVLWGVATTGTSNGSVNAALSSFLPLSGGIFLWLMGIGEVVFGGIGTGLTGAIVFLLIAVFAAGLMVGRTPEYLGKKIEVREMKPVALLAIFPAALTLMSTAYVLATQSGRDALSVRGPHGITEAFYAFASTALNNGSSFAGLDATAPLYVVMTTIVMYLGRMIPAVLLLALAGSIVEKKRVAQSAGTMPTDSLAFGIWLCFVIVMVGALNFLPALTLGPVIEHMNLFFPNR